MNIIQSFAGAVLVLPDGRFVLQRRTQDAPYGAGLLSIFGGMIEPNESPEVAVVRELEEETSLDVKSLKLSFRTDFTVSASGAYPADRHFYVYEGFINDLNFEVFEGAGAEAFSKTEIATRSDLTVSARRIFA